MKESIPLNWRRIKERYYLKATKCLTCNSIYFPPRSVCPKCRRKGKIVETKLSGKGEIYSFTRVYVPPEGLEKQAPYYLAIIKLKEGPMITAQIVDVEDGIKIGDRVEVVFRKLQQEDPEGVIHYGFKFRKVKEVE